jgi:hypothetical protein
MPDADLCFAHAVGIRSCWASYGYGDCDTCGALAPDFEIASGAVPSFFGTFCPKIGTNRDGALAARGITFGARQVRWRVAARPEAIATGPCWSRDRTTSSMAYGPAHRRGIAAVSWWPLKCSGKLGAVQRGATDSSFNCVIFSHLPSHLRLPDGLDDEMPGGDAAICSFGGPPCQISRSLTMTAIS